MQLGDLVGPDEAGRSLGVGGEQVAQVALGVAAAVRPRLVLDHRRVHVAGADGVGPDAARGELHRERLGQHRHARPCWRE